MELGGVGAGDADEVLDRDAVVCYALEEEGQAGFQARKPVGDAFEDWLAVYEAEAFAALGIESKVGVL